MSWFGRSHEAQHQGTTTGVATDTEALDASSRTVIGGVGKGGPAVVQVGVR